MLQERSVYLRGWSNLKAVISDSQETVLCDDG
jgi:hypothetical protein